MKFLIVDPHLWERIKDDPGVILGWDAAEIADRIPTAVRKLDRLRLVRFKQRYAAKKRLDTTAAIFHALEHMKRDLFAS